MRTQWKSRFVIALLVTFFSSQLFAEEPTTSFFMDFHISKQVVVAECLSPKMGIMVETAIGSHIERIQGLQNEFMEYLVPSEIPSVNDDAFPLPGRLVFDVYDSGVMNIRYMIPQWDSDKIMRSYFFQDTAGFRQRLNASDSKVLSVVQASAGCVFSVNTLP